LFPDGILSLNIFEIRYLKMIKKVSDERGCFGIILLKRGSETNRPGETEEFYDIGTKARIIRFETLQPTLFSISVKGEGRFKVNSASKGRYSLWSAEVSEVRSDSIVRVPESSSRLSSNLKDVFDLYGNKMFPPGWEMSDFDDRCHDAGWVANRWAELLPIGAVQKQSLLEEMDPLARLKKIDSILQ
jgi:hypothetical protein